MDDPEKFTRRRSLKGLKKFLGIGSKKNLIDVDLNVHSTSSDFSVKMTAIDNDIERLRVERDTAIELAIIMQQEFKKEINELKQTIKRLEIKT